MGARFWVYGSRITVREACRLGGSQVGYNVRQSREYAIRSEHKRVMKLLEEHAADK